MFASSQSWNSLPLRGASHAIGRGSLRPRSFSSRQRWWAWSRRIESGRSRSTSRTTTGYLRIEILLRGSTYHCSNGLPSQLSGTANSIIQSRPNSAGASAATPASTTGRTRRSGTRSVGRPGPSAPSIQVCTVTSKALSNVTRSSRTITDAGPDLGAARHRARQVPRGPRGEPPPSGLVEMPPERGDVPDEPLLLPAFGDVPHRPPRGPEDAERRAAGDAFEVGGQRVGEAHAVEELPQLAPRARGEPPQR